MAWFPFKQQYNAASEVLLPDLGITQQLLHTHGRAAPALYISNAWHEVIDLGPRH